MNTWYMVVIFIAAVLTLALSVWLWWRYRFLSCAAPNQRKLKDFLQALIAHLPGEHCEQILQSIVAITMERLQADDACFWLEIPPRHICFAKPEAIPRGSPLREADISKLIDIMTGGEAHLLPDSHLFGARTHSKGTILLIPIITDVMPEPKVTGGAALWWQKREQLSPLILTTFNLLSKFWGLTLANATFRKQRKQLLQALDNFAQMVYQLPPAESGKPLLSFLTNILQTLTLSTATVIYLHSPEINTATLLTSACDTEGDPLSWASKQIWSKTLSPLIGSERPITGNSLRQLFAEPQPSNMPEAPFLAIPLPADKKEGLILLVAPQVCPETDPQLWTKLSLLTGTIVTLAEREKELEVRSQPTIQTITRFLLPVSTNIMPPDRIEVFWPAQGYIPLTQLLMKNKLSQPEFITYLLQSADALAPFHLKNQSLLLNPDSILVDPLAKRVKLAPYPVNSSLAFPYFEGLSAPETRWHEFTPRSDIFFLGALTLYFYLGKFPPADSSTEGILKNLYLPQAPIGMDYLIRRSLWPTPSGRFANASEFASLLRQIQQRDTIQTLATRMDIGADQNVGLHKGRNRGYHSQDNEDCLFWDGDPEKALYLMAVADGVTRSDIGTGKEAAEILMQQVYTLWQTYIGSRQHPENIPLDLEVILNKANSDVVTKVGQYLKDKPPVSEYMSPMSTAACIIAVSNGKAIVVNVGNVRAYIVFGSCVAQLTQDDTLVTEAILDPGIKLDQAASLSGSVLSQVIGQMRMGDGGLEPIPLRPHFRDIILHPGEILVLVSDGAFGYNVDQRCFEEELLNIVQSSTSPQQAALRVVAMANEQDGHDNITCIVARAEE